MGVFSEIAIDQCSQDGAEPFQMDAYVPPIMGWREQSNLAEEPHLNTEPKGTETKNEIREEAKPEDSSSKQAAAEDPEQETLYSIANMSDDAVMLASAQRVSRDTEKITRRNMKDCVSEVIQTKCLDDPAFARLVMHPRKSMVNCFRYISRKAWEYVQDELKADGITPGNGAQGYGCDVPDDLCYLWAEEYFRDPDAKEDQVRENAASRTQPAKKESKSNAAKKKVSPPPEEEQISMDFHQLGKVG